ncbi:MAG: ImmA/IrrE family metallo-endopeptidase [Magnetococcales bacterium]|nr:ImmA/IrrE family metallo-endopeptidase [Magnetococcales bacterium]
MAKALINPLMLRWARERAGLTIDELARKFNKHTPKPQQIEAWEKGDKFPTFRQAETIANKTHIPFGYFYLPKPPQEEFPIPDLRTKKNEAVESPSANFYDLIQHVLFQKDWYRDYLLKHENQPLPFVGKYDLNTKPHIIAKDIRSTLNIESMAQSKNWEQHLDALYNRSEEIGIWVMRSSIIGNNTHRHLSVDEFRGFAICDTIVPLIFINSSDAKAGQIFTLAHELAHIWLGKSGISNLRLDEKSQDHNVRIERLCNAVAAETLVPQDHFLELWNDNEELENNIGKLTREFKVSSVVIARRAVTLDRLDWNTFSIYYQQEQSRWKKEQSRRKREENSGGDYYRVAPIRNGRRFTNAVLNNAMSGQLLLRDAGSLLHITPKNLQKLYLMKNQEQN